VTNTYEFEAIGTHWWLERLDGGKFDDAVRKALRAYTAEFDQRYSRFRDDSLIARLAEEGRLRSMPAEMFAMLTFASKLYDDTDGVFSPLVGNTLQTLGYGKLASETGLTSEESGLSWNRRSIRVQKGTILDFGGFGKGWLIDEYAKILRKNGVKEFIVNGGGDLYVEASKPISFALEHPYDPSLKIGDIKIQKGALAASSTVKRAWKQGRETYHHIIDPATGKPAESNVVATFVCAHTALVADSLATVLIIRPELRWRLEEEYNAETALITKEQLL
jgi:thiamine biosynthesis lipoprotein